MSSKDSIPAPDGNEKGVTTETPVAETGVSYHRDIYNSYDDEDFLTRNGLNANSFKCKHYGHGYVELDRTMKTRHLHMIAIGGSIGAGFFVGSGSAFASGVSRAFPSPFFPWSLFSAIALCPIVGSLPPSRTGQVWLKRAFDRRPYQGALVVQSHSPIDRFI